MWGLGVCGCGATGWHTGRWAVCTWGLRVCGCGAVLGFQGGAWVPGQMAAGKAAKLEAATTQQQAAACAGAHAKQRRAQLPQAATGISSFTPRHIQRTTGPPSHTAPAPMHMPSSPHATLFLPSTPLLDDQHPSPVNNPPRAPQAVKFVDELMAIRTDKLGPDTLLAAAKTSMGSKIVGSEGEFFAKMVVEAIQAVKSTDQVGVAWGLVEVWCGGFGG